MAKSTIELEPVWKPISVDLCRGHLERDIFFETIESQELDKRFLIRRLFIKWQKQTKLFILYENVLQEKYEKLCSEKLSRWRQRVRLNQQAAAWRKVCLLDTFTKKWRLKLEEKEDEEIKSKLMIADDYAKEKLRAKYFSIWFRYLLHLQSHKKLLGIVKPSLPRIKG